MKNTNKSNIPLNYIIETLLKGSGFVEGKKRIWEMYQKDLKKAERISFLKNEYGIGGCGWPLDGYGLHGYDHDAKGIALQWRDALGEHKETLSWTQVDNYVGNLINSQDYYCPTVTSDIDVWSHFFE